MTFILAKERDHHPSPPSDLHFLQLQYCALALLQMCHDIGRVSLFVFLFGLAFPSMLKYAQ